MEITVQKQNSTRVDELTDSASAILKTLLYFDVFKYPLTFEELLSYTQYIKISSDEAQSEIALLQNKGWVEKSGDFLYLKGKHFVVARRLEGNKLAQKRMTLAKKMSELIVQFPFVKSVCISGSLSKNYMDEDSDIDFFIITEPGRLWLCRGLLVLFKKVFLLNSRRHFCINYYVDSTNLEIPERNIFTATEITFLLPTYNSLLFDEFRKRNNWTHDFYPNLSYQGMLEKPLKNSIIKQFFERILNGTIGEKMDALFFKLTLRRWKNKFSHFSKEEFDLNLRSRKSVSKHHPRGYQKVVLDRFQEKLDEFERANNVKLL
ncbi:MAG TPA: nucleotidyltransferase domain-containing protein [Bacteroidia bacterium]|nr:nucleotidyltransferase domain-containing protein [Bacteroidia bacterium]HRH09033.1 nucleotidyltransferase domain-containing protein [Bacteroidia bacterium]